MPRKFDANIAMVFKNAPRFSSTPVWSTRAGASVGGGGTPSVLSLALTREPGQRLGRFLYYMSWENASRFTFRRNMLDVTELKTNIRAHIVLDATID
jgi:hypothetical protein